MATRTEKLIGDMRVEIAQLKERVEAMRAVAEAVQQLAAQSAVLQAQVAELTKSAAAQAELAKQVAVLQSQVADLTKTRELWGQRGWAVFTVAVSAAFSLLTGTATAVLAYYLNLKK